MLSSVLPVVKQSGITYNVCIDMKAKAGNFVFFHSATNQDNSFRSVPSFKTPLLTEKKYYFIKFWDRGNHYQGTVWLFVQLQGGGEPADWAELARRHSGGKAVQHTAATVVISVKRSA